MGWLSKTWKKTNPIAVDRAIARKVVAPIARKIGGDRLAAPADWLGNSRTNTANLKTIKREGVSKNIGSAFRSVDRSFGRFTPLQTDYMIARRANKDRPNPISRLVMQTTGRGPADGSDNRFYDSDRNVTIAAAVVGGSFAAGAWGGAGQAAGDTAILGGAEAGAAGGAAGGATAGSSWWATLKPAAQKAAGSLLTAAMKPKNNPPALAAGMAPMDYEPLAPVEKGPAAIWSGLSETEKTAASAAGIVGLFALLARV